MKTTQQFRRGTGAIPRAKDPRDLLYADLIAGSAPVDWNQSYDVRDDGIIITIEDQGSRQSCVGQATAKLAEILEQYETHVPVSLSAVDVYSHIRAPDGGAILYKGPTLLLNRGVATEKLVPSYSVTNGVKTPVSEEIASVPNDTPPVVQNASIYKIQSYASVDDNVDEFAHAIKTRHFVIFGVIGSWEGWTNGTFPRPPQDKEEVWYHALLAIGYKIINNKKYVVVVNSWSEAFGDHGFLYLSEDYFGKAWIFNAMTAVDAPDPRPITFDMKDTIRLANHQDQYTLTDGKRALIPDAETLQFLVDQKIVSGEARVVGNDEYARYPDSGVVWPSIKVMKALKQVYPTLQDAFENQ